MEQKFYVASKGDSYLSLTNHPGQLTEGDIVSNIQRMMEMDLYEDEDVSWSQMRSRAREFYEENIERIMEMVYLRENLVEITEEQAEELQGLSFEDWMAWEFPRTEWD